MKKIYIGVMALFLSIVFGISASATTSYGDAQIIPVGHPHMIYTTMESKGDYHRFTIGFDSKEPMLEKTWSINPLFVWRPVYKIDSITINGETFEPTYDGAGASGSVVYTGAANYLYDFNGLPSEVEAYYEIDFYNFLPQTINGKFYIQEIKFSNEAYDVVSGIGVPVATYEFRHNDLEKYPRIDLNFGDTWSHEVGYTFVEPGFSAYSTFDTSNPEDLTSSVVIDYGGITPGETIDIADTYIIRYSVEDSLGNVGYTERMLVIGDSAEPEFNNDSTTPEDTFITDSTNSTGDTTTVLPSVDLTEVITQYWWVAVLLVFIIFTVMKGTASGVFMSVVVLIVLFMVYGNDLFDSRLLDLGSKVSGFIRGLVGSA